MLASILLSITVLHKNGSILDMDFLNPHNWDFPREGFWTPPPQKCAKLKSVQN